MESLAIEVRSRQNIRQHQAYSQNNNHASLPKRISSYALLLLGGIQFVPRIPRPIRSAAGDIVRFCNAAEYSQAMGSDQQIRAKVLKSLNFFVNPQNLSLMEETPLAAGYLPESEWYQAALDFADLSLFVSGLPLPTPISLLAWLALDRSKEYYGPSIGAKLLTPSEKNRFLRNLTSS